MSGLAMIYSTSVGYFEGCDWNLIVYGARLRIELIDVMVSEDLFDQQTVLLRFGIFRVKAQYLHKIVQGFVKGTPLMI